MRKILLVIVILSGIIPLTAKNVLAQQVESQGQILLALGKTFADHPFSKNISSGIYVNASGMIPIRSTPQLFGYIGPELTVYDSNFKLLTGTYMTSDGGMSLIGSVWYNQVLPFNLNLFLEGDAYFPIDGEGFGHEFRQYFTIFNLIWTINTESGVGIGVAEENFFSENDVYEVAIGPTLNFSKGSLWLAYDFTPAISGDRSLLLRLSLNF